MEVEVLTHSRCFLLSLSAVYAMSFLVLLGGPPNYCIFFGGNVKTLKTSKPVTSEMFVTMEIYSPPQLVDSPLNQ